MPKSALLEQVHQTCRLKHFSMKTEKAYLIWIRRFILFNNKRHPKELGDQEISKCKSITCFSILLISQYLGEYYVDLLPEIDLV
jgi:hypothetical protein